MRALRLLLAVGLLYARHAMLDRGGIKSELQIIITLAPEGDTAADIKNDTPCAISAQMEKKPLSKQAAE